MDQKGNMPQGNVEVPIDMLMQMIGEKDVTIRVQGQRLQAMVAELQRMRAQAEQGKAEKKASGSVKGKKAAGPEATDG